MRQQNSHLSLQQQFGQTITKPDAQIRIQSRKVKFESMSEPQNNSIKVKAAVDAVLRKQQDGQLSSSKRGSMASELRHRITDLQTLNDNLSAAAIATELTAAGCPVSASTVQRVLRETPPGKRKKGATIPATMDAGKQPLVAPVTLVAPPAPTVVPKPASPTPAAPATATDAAALLAKMQKENQHPSENPEKRTATLKK